MKSYNYLFFLILLIVFSSCATMTDVLKNKDEGTAKIYDVDNEVAWEIAITVLRWEGCETIEQHKTSNYMLTTVGANFVSDGTLVGVWVDPVGNDKTNVTVVTKRKIQTNLATGLTETTFHSSYKTAVDLIKQGKTLPIEKPSME
jgi:hypothetical protein